MRLPPLALLIPPALAHAFSCAVSTGPVTYDLDPLRGLRRASRESSTPPTRSEARVLLDLCAEGGVGREDGVSDEDQCAPDTRVCLKLLNHKDSAPDPARVTAVIPVWQDDSTVSYVPLGSRGERGLTLSVVGPEYAGDRQYLNFTLLCDRTATDPEPTLESYSAGVLALQWATPDACPRGTSSDEGGAVRGGGGGLWGFIKLVFWMLVLGLLLYFGIGMFYNHQQYSARGWDLVPHRDFWRELPALCRDVATHLLAGVGGGGRGGYSSLG
ncbi:type II membrane protein [Cryptotrichosporon argae]